MDTEELLKIATIAARRYARRVWWAKEEDMRQEALVAVLKARETFDPTHGAPFGAYALRAAMLAIRPYLWKNSSPVSESWHKLPTLRGVHRAPLTDAKDVLASTACPEAQLEHATWHEAVRDRLLALDPSRGLGLAVLLERQKPEAVAQQHNVSLAEVRRAVARLRTAVRNDYSLWKLHWNGEP